MKETEYTWRTSFVPGVMGDVEQEPGFDDPDLVYLAHSANIEEGVQALAAFIRAHAQILERAEYILKHGCQGRPTGVGTISGRDFIDVLRGFLTLICKDSIVQFARRSAQGKVGDEVTFEVRIFKGECGDFHIQARQQSEGEGLKDTQSLDILQSCYPSVKRIGKSLRMRLRLDGEPMRPKDGRESRSA